jgi:ubiquinol-cytochrome c reductase cytochrome b subunit
MRALLGRLYRQGRADRWSSVFGQIAVYSLVVTAISGVFLLFYFRPSMTTATCHGSYGKLNGVPMSQAYRSTLDISFDVRGGLLMRQVHHWAALLFIAAVCGHLLRLYFTGAFRRRRWLDWVIWVTMLALGMAAGLSGTILPDDSMSGGSLDVPAGVTLSVPVIGSQLALWIFGGGFPGQHQRRGGARLVHGLRRRRARTAAGRTRSARRWGCDVHITPQGVTVTPRPAPEAC